MTNDKTVTMSRELAGLSEEARSVVIGMIEHCLNIRACMGMDEGYNDYENEESEHDFVKEIRAFVAKANDAAPVVERQEPESPNKRCSCKAGRMFWSKLHQRHVSCELHASPPAPVALPGRTEFESIARSECLERLGVFVPARASDGGYRNVTTDMLWNCFKACLDKVKEMNR